jgi:hypothetical protein
VGGYFGNSFWGSPWVGTEAKYVYRTVNRYVHT